MSNKEKQEILDKYKKDISEAIEELKTPGKRHRQIPNILTASRLLAPLAILPAAFSGNVPLTAGLALGFGLTDCVDGAIARKFDLQSDLGKDLDAVTDKVFVGTLLIASAFFNPILLCNLGLEGAIAAINVKQKMSGKETGSTMIGKYKTWAVFGLAALGLIAPEVGLSTLVNVLALGTAAMQGLTIGSYLTKYGKSDKMTQTPEKNPTIVDEIIPDEIKLPHGQKVRAKTYEAPSATVSEQLEGLREMSEFLHQEQANQHGETETKPNVYQKTDKHDN